MRKLFLLLTLIYSTTLFTQISFATNLHKSDSLFQLNIGKQYPSFSVATLDDKIINEKELVGNVTIINFWFAYCEPCVAEFDALNELYQKFKENSKFRFISLTSDAPNEAKESVRKYQLPYSVCPVSSQECYRLNFNSGFPTTIIVDDAGKIVYLKSGGNTDKDKAFQDVKQFDQQIKILLDKLSNRIYN